jgi:hypothetical protein
MEEYVQIVKELMLKSPTNDNLTCLIYHAPNTDQELHTAPSSASETKLQTCPRRAVKITIYLRCRVLSHRRTPQGPLNHHRNTARPR